MRSAPQEKARVILPPSSLDQTAGQATWLSFRQPADRADRLGGLVREYYQVAA
jgi:hypothetical protein